MAAADESTRSGLSRRDALRMLAASTGTVAAASVIVSQPALAAPGTEGCAFEFSSDPQVTVQALNRSGNQKDDLNISVSPIDGECQCENSATVEFAYHVSATAGSGGSGWRSGWTSASVTTPTVLWPTGGGNPPGTVTVRVAVRVTCGSTAVCRSGSGGPYSITNPSGTLLQTFYLTTESSSSPLPDCGAGTGQASGTVTFAQGAQALRLDAAVEAPAVDLGPAEPATSSTEATTTTTSSTTTTTTTTEVPAPSETSTSTSSTPDE